MTKKDYIKFAQLLNGYARFGVEEGHARHDIGTIKLNLGGVINQIGDIFEDDNPNFDRVRFVNAIEDIND